MREASNKSQLTLLGHFNQYPSSKFKVDRKFRLGQGHDLGMQIVVDEETTEQVLTVSEAGWTLGQCYYFRHPITDYRAAILLAKERLNFVRSGIG